MKGLTTILNFQQEIRHIICVILTQSPRRLRPPRPLLLGQSPSSGWATPAAAPSISPSCPLLSRPPRTRPPVMQPSNSWYPSRLPSPDLRWQYRTSTSHDRPNNNSNRWHRSGKYSSSSNITIIIIINSTTFSNNTFISNKIFLPGIFQMSRSSWSLWTLWV